MVLSWTISMRDGPLISFLFTFIELAIIFRSAMPKQCYDDGREFCIYQEDILSVDLLPDSFLLVDQNLPLANVTSRQITSDGTIDEAFNAMGFHRRKINEYLCHGFLAEQILTDVGGVRVKRRLDQSSLSALSEYFGDNNLTTHDILLSDEGSSKYKDWLTKTATLDDIYRRYSPHTNVVKKQLPNRREEIEGDEYDGAVTGYAMPAPILTGKVGGYFDSSGPGSVTDYYASPSWHQPQHADHNSHHGPDFPPSNYEHHGYGPPTSFDEYHHVEHHHKPHYHHGKGKGHELSLKDFFEIALTALAFLAFGLFIIQLIMNVTNASTATAASFLQADIDGTRFKRDSPKFSPWAYSGNQELNELSQRVMRSIEAALVAEQDSGNCFRKVLCEDNRNSRAYGSARKIWVPVWSLGMSWLSGLMMRQTRWSESLGSVKATVLGLGGADCDALFPNCNLQREVTNRRYQRRRRK